MREVSRILTREEILNSPNTLIQFDYQTESPSPSPCGGIVFYKKPKRQSVIKIFMDWIIK